MPPRQRRTEKRNHRHINREGYFEPSLWHHNEVASFWNTSCGRMVVISDKCFRSAADIS